MNLILSVILVQIKKVTLMYNLPAKNSQAFEQGIKAHFLLKSLSVEISVFTAIGSYQFGYMLYSLETHLLSLLLFRMQNKNS